MNSLKTPQSFNVAIIFGSMYVLCRGLMIMTAAEAAASSLKTLASGYKRSNLTN
jgi:hypothetical protein